MSKSKLVILTDGRSFELCCEFSIAAMLAKHSGSYVVEV